MPTKERNKKSTSSKLKDGAFCNVISGTHSEKSGTVGDINTSKTGAVTITVVQANGVRFKTLDKNVNYRSRKTSVDNQSILFCAAWRAL